MDKIPRIDQILVDTLTKMIGQLTSFIPKLILAIVVFVIGLFIAKLVRFILKNVLKKINIDRIGDKINEIDFIKKFKIEVVISTVISSILYYFILMIFISAATETLGVKVITDLVASMINMVPQIVAAMILLVVGLLVADGLQKTVTAACKSLNISSAKLIGNIVFFFLLIITIIAALGQAGINTSLLETSFTIIIAGIIFAFSFGYGFASKDVLANMISSFYNKSKFTKGQVIEIEGIKGEVTNVDSTSIELKTGETKTIIPLNILQTKQVILFENK